MARVVPWLEAARLVLTKWCLKTQTLSWYSGARTLAVWSLLLKRRRAVGQKITFMVLCG